jgi:hypothetical protein
MSRTLQCPAGEWTTIFDHAFVQMPWTWIITFTSSDGSPVSGEIAEKRSSWIFPNPPVSRPLVAQMEFHRGWFNTFYSVRVKPDQDVFASW